MGSGQREPISVSARLYDSPSIENWRHKKTDRAFSARRRESSWIQQRISASSKQHKKIVAMTPSGMRISSYREYASGFRRSPSSARTLESKLDVSLFALLRFIAFSCAAFCLQCRRAKRWLHMQLDEGARPDGRHHAVHVFLGG
jgi:hypothetical protein